MVTNFEHIGKKNENSSVDMLYTTFGFLQGTNKASEQSTGEMDKRVWRNDRAAAVEAVQWW